MAPVGDHLHHPQGLVDTRQNLRGRQPQVLRAEGDVLLDDRRHQLVVGVLEDHPHALTDLPQHGAIAGVHAVDEDLAVGRQQQGVEVFGEGGFA